VTKRPDPDLTVEVDAREPAPREDIEVNMAGSLIDELVRNPPPKTPSEDPGDDLVVLLKPKE